MHRIPGQTGTIFLWLLAGAAAAGVAGCGYERFDLSRVVGSVGGSAASSQGGTVIQSGGSGGGAHQATGASSGSSGSSGSESVGGNVQVGGSGPSGGRSSGGGVPGAGGSESGESGGEGGALPPLCPGPECDLRPCCQDLLFECQPLSICPYCQDDSQCRKGFVCDAPTSQCLPACGSCPAGFTRCDEARGVCSQCLFDYDCLPGQTCVQGLCQSCKSCQ